MASRNASRTVMVTISVPSGTSDSGSTAGCGGAAVAGGGGQRAGLLSPSSSRRRGTASAPLASSSACPASPPFAGGSFRLAPSVIVEASSPSPKIMAMGVLTATSLVPSGTRILPSVPSSTASPSMVALSVSISAMTSPDLTASPSFLCHLARFPFSMVGESAGIKTSIGIDASPVGGLAGDPREIGRYRCRGSGDNETGEKINERFVYGINVRRMNAPESVERELLGHHGSNTGGRCEPRMPGLSGKQPQCPRVEPAARDPARERAGEREEGHNRCEECHVLPGVHIGPKLRRIGL